MRGAPFNAPFPKCDYALGDLAAIPVLIPYLVLPGGGWGVAGIVGGRGLFDRDCGGRQLGAA
jgi:hypothetical protein